MPFVGVTHSKQLDMLAGVLDEYCGEQGIERSSPERAEVGRRVTILFENGWRTRNELKMRLTQMMRFKPRLH